MAVNFNSTVSAQLPDELAAVERALFFADSLFESIRVCDGHLPFWPRHFARLSAGMNALGYAIPEDWTADFFRREIEKIAPRNARVRLTVWRSPGGLYLPDDNVPQFLITVTPLEQAGFQWPAAGISLGVCEQVCLAADDFSRYKTLNAARYVVAAREARACGWDDGLLRNAAGRIAEATSSNVFWWENDRLHTPPLTEGCVAGVFRAWLLEKSAGSGVLMMEKTVLPGQLSAASEIFLTNAVRGILPVRIFAGRSLPSDRTRALFDEVMKNG